MGHVLREDLRPIERQIQELRLRLEEIERRLGQHDELFRLNTTVHSAIAEQATAVERALIGITYAITTPFGKEFELSFPGAMGKLEELRGDGSGK
jgi:hypothetical protein